MDFETIDRLNERQVVELYEMYQMEWWTRGRRLDDVQAAVANSDVIVAIMKIETEELVAFSRVLTDYVYKAIIFDVIVKAPYRGERLGRRIMDTITAYPSLRKVKHFELYCRPEMVPFYQKWGFTSDLGELEFIRRG
ncbi:GNAT family N-acetyltransferase [Alicyclobacillus sp. ALC3]|uniref:GNAT family N-acetyltransferase n=1 Tax=Alicyclobacillus sp. ALC3 TaxID=2796143 RepID=UPI002379804A|nr:GNAT family N-acetyltransferase [Alicyclobacillus sp. ALC3]WDL95350.1 GNAT family N-acetyltransferase [Alicyclobacillus sp. ALC3]